MHPSEKPADGISNSPMPQPMSALSAADNEKPQTPRRRFRRWFRWFLWSLPVVFFLLAVVGAFVLLGHGMVVHRLEEATAEMDVLDPGWRLEDIEAARASVPDKENGIFVVLAAADLLPKGWPKPEIAFFDSDADLPPNNARLDFDQRNRLRVELESLNAARVEARKLATRSTGRYALVYQRNFLSMLIPHVGAARKVTRLLMLDALLHMEDGDFAEAAVSCQAAFNAGRAIGDEPLAISQVVRAACVQSTMKAIERLLAQGELDDMDLAALQRIIEDEAKHPALRLAYRGERALMHNLLHAMEDGDISLDDMGDHPAPWSERCRTFFGRDGLRRQHTRAFSIWNKVAEISETPPHLRAGPLLELRVMVAAHPNDLAALLASGWESMEGSSTRYGSHLTCLAVALAAERYRRLHDHWPLSLEALTPKFLDTAPLDNFDAQPLRYHRLPDGVVIYSLCPDGKERVYDPEKPSPPGEGIAVRLWNVEQRGKGD